MNFLFCFLQTMIKSRLFKLKNKLQTKKLQFELEQLERQRQKAYALHLRMLQQINSMSSNQVAEPQQQVAQLEQRQLEQEECCCCCCCYGCDLTEVSKYDEYDENLANENIENQFYC